MDRTHSLDPFLPVYGIRKVLKIDPAADQTSSFFHSLFSTVTTNAKHISDPSGHYVICTNYNRKRAASTDFFKSKDVLHITERFIRTQRELQQAIEHPLPELFESVFPVMPAFGTEFRYEIYIFIHKDSYGFSFRRNKQSILISVEQLARIIINSLQASAVDWRSFFRANPLKLILISCSSAFDSNDSLAQRFGRILFEHGVCCEIKAPTTAVTARRYDSYWNAFKKMQTSSRHGRPLLDLREVSYYTRRGFFDALPAQDRAHFSPDHPPSYFAFIPWKLDPEEVKVKRLLSYEMIFKFDIEHGEIIRDATAPERVVILDHERMRHCILQAAWGRIISFYKESCCHKPIQKVSEGRFLLHFIDGVERLGFENHEIIFGQVGDLLNELNFRVRHLIDPKIDVHEFTEEIRLRLVDYCITRTPNHLALSLVP